MFIDRTVSSLNQFCIFWRIYPPGFNPSNAETTTDAKIFENDLNCHVGIHWKALAEYSQISTHV